MIANDSITALYFRGGSVRLPLRDLFCPRESSGRLLLPCQAYFIYPRKTAISPGVIAISSGEMRIYCRGMPIHFQLISSSINGISADIISISAYRKAIYDYRKAVPVLFYVALFCILCTLRAAELHKKCKKHTAIKE